MATIVAVFAHPDDETFICGGTLARYAREGNRVVLVCATKGEMGRRMGIPPVVTRESLPEVREQELRAACHALGIEELRFLGLRDKLLEIQPFDRLRDQILAHLEDLQPDAVVTFHERLGGHPDHCTIGLATKAAFYQFHTTVRSRKPAKLFYVCWPGVAQHAQQYGLLPQQITKIDVKAYNPMKLKAFRAHKTQSDIDEWVWKRDEISLRKFGSHEFFIQADEPYFGHADSLFEK